MVIYKTTNIINNKVYIGQDKNNRQHYFGSGNLIKRAIKKYGKDNFIKEILCVCDTMDDLNNMERFFINKYKSTEREIGYNIAVGGTNGVMLNRKHTDETKEKMRLSSLGRKKSKEHCINIGLSQKGRIISNEEKRKRSENSPLKGIKKCPLSLEVKKKISNSKIGKFPSKETKEKMSESHMGIKNSFYGKKHSEEYLLKRKKPIIQLDKNSNFIKEWSSITDASNHLKIQISGISFVLSGKYKTSGGFKFKFKK